MIEPSEPPSRPSWWRIIAAVAAGAVGVQTRANLERDMRSRSPWPYIVAGLIGTALFILTVVSVVRWVLSSAT